MAGNLPFFRRGGFTLLEVLIAVSLLATAVSVVYFLYGAMVATVERVDERTGRNDQARIILERINHDLAGLFRGDIGYLIGTATDFREEEPFLEFLSTSGLGFDPHRPRLPLNRIALFLAQEEDGTSTLLRSEVPVLPGADLETRAQFGGQVLCRGLAAVELSFLQGTEERDEWNSRAGFADSAPDERFPTVIRLQLIFAAEANVDSEVPGERYATAVYLRPTRISAVGD
ncbi:PulJ/GspJ family protein [Desulfofustis limnaeus]|uniref:Prepilin-type N-terminal cleavage/methylation domain-containing protein n=1 Tax=Desulfofustis limnaeus TaxID=2740163 RepID=A0ABM7W6Y5_9BACT|nr:prepilin-type N-terminal cleavage/methylation domain-containing protein [Desulfofustis limnaeus]BDD86650.1 hypothetical protein DPPLL_10150 [Desulfofustis limnaeus]